MPALTHAHIALVRRNAKTWTSKNKGVMVVFCIIATIAIVVIALVVQRKLAAARVRKEREEFMRAGK